MTSLNAANLPSDDEEDDDYDPTAEDKMDSLKTKQSSGKRRRAAASKPDAGEGTEALQDEDPAEPEGPANPAKKAKFDQLWASLNQTKAPKQLSLGINPATGQDSALTKENTSSIAKPFSLAAICRPVATTRKADSDADWKRQLGIKSRPDSKPEDQDSKQRAAAAAAAAAAQAQLPSSSKQTITETRRFAGKDIEFTRAANRQDAEAKKAKSIKQGGLDNLLSSLQQARKVNVLDKSRMDWGDFKTSNVKVDEELEGYKKSGDKYLDKVDFLQRAELRQYEQERDQRLSQDIRSRGRL